MAESSRYSRLLPGSDPYSPRALFSSGSDTPHHGDNESEDSIPMTPSGAPLLAKRAAKTKNTASAAPPRGYLPTSRRFWADFTLGFADGLTVPFALTAGLSSLGQTDTVVYAGLAEVSAGCISMGIGGYLSARQASPSTSLNDVDDGEGSVAAAEDLEAPRSSNENHEKRAARAARATRASSAVTSRYLAPLSLPPDLQQLVMAHVDTHPGAIDAILDAETQKREESEYGFYGKQSAQPEDSDAGGGDDNEDDSVWPVASGVSVALGYLIGGLLPLWPYFFVERVGDGLRWSFAVCVVALFLFGFLRDFALDSAAAAADSRSSRATSARQLSWHRSRIPWRRLWKSTFEGLQMVILGGIAAIVAVLCVRMFESEKSG